MNILRRLFSRPREYMTHGAETRDGVKHSYRRRIDTGEIEVTSTRDRDMLAMTFAPKQTKLSELRRSVAGNGGRMETGKHKIEVTYDPEKVDEQELLRVIMDYTDFICGATDHSVFIVEEESDKE